MRTLPGVQYRELLAGTVAGLHRGFGEGLRKRGSERVFADAAGGRLSDERRYDEVGAGHGV